MRKIKLLLCLLTLVTLAFLAAGCADKKETTTPTEATSPAPTGEEEPSPTGQGNGEQQMTEYPLLSVNLSAEHQTIEGFGTSSCWWSQYVGGWDKPYKAGDLPVREQIAKWLYSREDGIGLTIYRYNLGAGSAQSGKGNFWYNERRAQSFMGVDGNYNWNRDKNAVWFMNYCVELGAKDVVFFCNSPIEQLTVNGMAHMSKDSSINLAPENYDDFAKYVFDVAEHFIAEGIPVTMVSPINEPQWDWLEGQEGCHYEPDEVVGVLKAFVTELRARGLEDKISITSPESGEWGGKARNYVNAILSDELLGSYFKSIDCHSYWTNKSTKEKFKEWMDSHYPSVNLVMSEWCEMVNGKDYTMDSAFNMADVMWEDLTVLDVTSWQYWVGVADGDYRDGLIYVNKDAKAARANRRLWTLGNFSKFVRPGFVRVETATEDSSISELKPMAFKGVDDDGKEKLVLVFINRKEAQKVSLDIAGDYKEYHVYTTSETSDLSETSNGTVEKNTGFEIGGQSIVTVVLEK